MGDTFFSKKSIASRTAQRTIQVNYIPIRAVEYVSNQVRTSKYTFISFLPKNIISQFKGLANFYFLAAVVLQIFPEFSQVNVIIPILPILIIVLVTAMKDGIEDMKRHMSDDEVNQSPTYVLAGWINSNNPAEVKSIFGSILSQLSSICAHVLSFSSVFFKSKVEEFPKKISYKDYILKSSQTSLPDLVSKSNQNDEPKTSTRGRYSWELSRWANLRVGDFLLLRNNERIPADVIIISTGEPDCICYVETKNLDGETNLKIKKGIKELSHIQKPEHCENLKCFLEVEPPNPNLYTFKATLTTSPDAKPISIGPSGLLLRGCVVRNTGWVIALVVYTGKDSKIMLNSGPTPSKRSRIDKQVNPRIVLNAFILILLCLICGLNAILYTQTFSFELASYISPFSNAFDSVGYTFFITFFNCLIIFQQIIPIALYISLEISKSVQSFLIYLDVELYDVETNQCAQPKAWNLCDDLGQIEYIFSDKTGTLTSNVMDFKKASINGISYGKWKPQSEGNLASDALSNKSEKDAMVKGLKSLFDCRYVDKNPGFVDSKLAFDIMGENNQSIKIREFFSLLSICHTVMVEKSDPSNIDDISYRAQSPDEAALVTAAKNVGFACLNRSENRIEVDVMGNLRTYTILNLMEFNSDRKRMSVIVQRPEGEILLLCKGADSVIYERLDLQASESLIDITTEHLELYANNGLRTLCLAYRVLSNQEYKAWNELYSTAQASIEDREALCDAAAEKIEKNLILMGATAIEDKLQDGVPESISLLMKAGIKIWVLTVLIPVILGR